MPEQFHIKNLNNEIRTWYLSESLDILKNKALLNENETSKFTSLKNENAKKSFLGLRILRKEMGCGEISYLATGKPIVDSGYISMTHSGLWVAMIFSERQEVGIDIEGIHPRILKIKDRFLSTEEQNNICKEQLLLYTLCWSAKEAVFKKYGHETVFFKEHQRILLIDEKEQRIHLELTNHGKKIKEELNYFLTDEKTVLVYTL